MAAQEPPNVQRVIDLKSVGYPRPPCDYMFQDHSYTKNHLEFLDSERLMVSFPADTSNCYKKEGYGGRSASKFRSVIMDLSGQVLHSFDWNIGDHVPTGPDGYTRFLNPHEPQESSAVPPDQLADECWSDRIVQKRWLVPGGIAWISRQDSYVSVSGRVMCFTTGTLFPITDTSGFGYFLRVAVLDMVERRVVFRKQYKIDSDVALSPDGHWFAVREQTRLTLHRLK